MPMTIALRGASAGALLLGTLAAGAAARGVQPAPSEAIRLNQLGYPTAGPKVAVVVGADIDQRRLDAAVAAVRTAVPGARITGQVIDLLDPQEVHDWADHLTAEHGHVDGLLHLVGGWRGGKRFADTDPDDWDFLHDRVVRTLQHTTLAFQPALLRAPAGRFAMVSAAAAHRPTAGGAAYAAAKAAAEAWTLSLAPSFTRETAAGGRAEDGAPLTAAAAILVVRALVTPEMRAQRPDAAFAGATDTADLADARAWAERFTWANCRDRTRALLDEIAR